MRQKPRRGRATTALSWRGRPACRNNSIVSRFKPTPAPPNPCLSPKIKRRLHGGLGCVAGLVPPELQRLPAGAARLAAASGLAAAAPRGGVIRRFSFGHKNARV